MGGFIPVPWQQGPWCRLLPAVSGATVPQSESGPRPARHWLLGLGRSVPPGCSVKARESPHCSRGALSLGFPILRPTSPGQLPRFFGNPGGSTSQTSAPVSETTSNTHAFRSIDEAPGPVAKIGRHSEKQREAVCPSRGPTLRRLRIWLGGRGKALRCPVTLKSARIGTRMRVVIPSRSCLSQRRI